MNSVIATVQSIVGQVFAVSADGARRLLVEGDRLFKGEEVLTGDSGMVTLVLADGRTLDLGRDSQWSESDTRLADQAAQPAQQVVSPGDEVAQLQKAIEAGLDPTENLAATAAGPSAAGGGTGGAGGGHSFVLLDATGEVLQATVGFETQGLGDFDRIDDETREALPNQAPEFIDGAGATQGPFNLQTAEDTPLSGTFITRDANGDLVTLTVTRQPTNGTLQLNPNGTWTYTPAQDYNGSDSFEVTASDSRGASTPLTVNLNVTPVNDAPVASGSYDASVDDTAAADTFADIKGQLAATDVDDTVLTWSGSATGAYGELTVNPDGSYSYVVDAAKVNALAKDEAVSESFTVTVKDPSGASDTRVITINFTGDNDTPIASASTAAVREDQGITGTLVATDADKGAVLSYAVDGKAPAGFTLNTDGSWTFDASASDYQSLAEDQTLTLTIKYTVTDEHGAQDSNTLTVTVTGVNDAAILGSADVQLTENNAPLTTAGTLSISDVDSPATFVAQSNVAGQYGTFSINAAGAWTFVANSAFNELNVGDKRSESFDVFSVDGTKSSVTVTINGSNDAPVGVSDSVTLNEDSTATGNVLSNDTDVDNTSLSVTKFSLTSLPFVSFKAGETADLIIGKLTIKANGDYSFTPAKDYNGPVPSITYTLSDGSATSTATLTFDITPVNDAPVNTVPGAQTLNEDSSKTFGLLSGNSIAVKDIDGDQLTTTLSVEHGVLTLGPLSGGVSFSGNGTGSITLVGSQTAINAALQGLKYVPAKDYNGQDTLTINTTDGKLSDSDSVTLKINPVNDAPVATPTSDATTEDAPIIGGKLAATDVDGDTLTYSAQGTLPGGFSLKADGTWTLDPSHVDYQHLAEGKSTTLTINFTATDGKLSSSNTLTIVVTGVNDNPTITAATAAATEGNGEISGEIVANDVDDGAVLSFSTTANVTGLTLSSDGKWTFDANNSAYDYLKGGEKLVIEVPVSVTDEYGASANSTLTITLTGTNDAPVANAVSSSGNEDQAARIRVNLSGSDVDGTVTGFTIGTLPANGTLYAGANGGAALKAGDSVSGPVYFVPNKDWNGTTSFEYSAVDNNGAVSSSTATATINVAAVNDRPVGVNDSVTLAEDSVATGNVLSNDRDVDGDSLVVTKFNITGFPLISGKAGDTIDLLGTGKLTIKANGDYSFTPAKDYNGPVPSVTYTLSDGKLTDTATLRFDITPVNDAPVNSTPGAQTLNEDGSKVFSIFGDNSVSVNDVDGDKLTTTLSVEHGALTLGPILANGLTYSGNGTGSITLSGTQAAINLALQGLKYVPAANYNGQDTLTISTSDGSLNDIDSITLTITPVNDAPVASPTSDSTIEDAPAIGGKLAASDVDGDTLTFSLDNSAPAGFSLKTDGSWTFDPSHSAYQALSQGEKLVIQIPFTATDGSLSSSSTLTITVTGVNDVPVVTGAISYGTNEDAAGHVIDLLVNASDADGKDVLNAVNIRETSGNDASGVNVQGNTLVVDPSKYNYLGDGESVSLTFTYQVSDGKGGLVDTSATITIDGVNDAPLVSSTSLTVAEESTGTPLNLAAPSDVDATDTLTIRVTGLPSVGQITLADGSLVSAGQALTSAELQGLKYNAPADYDAGTPVGNFTYSVSDGKVSVTGSVSLGVTPVNDAPQTGNVSANGDEDSSGITVTLSGSDIDGSIDHFVIKSLPANGTLLLNGVALADGDSVPATANGASLTFVPNPNWNGQTAFTYASVDDQGLEDSTPATASVTVNAVNDAPVVSSTSLTVAEESIGTDLGLGAPTDVDGDVLTITVSGLPTVGQITLANGTPVNNGQTLTTAELQGLKYNGPADYKAGDPVGDFKYTVNDGTTSVEGKVTLGVTPINDAPVATDDFGVIAGLKGNYYAYNEGSDGGNLENLSGVNAFIAGRTPNATFTATELNYGNGVGSNLGNDQQLQKFLGTDAGSLNTDPVNSSDAIIELSGQINLNAGTYQFRVTADDGYSIVIDGKVVAEYNGNQSPTERESSTFTISESGAHTIQIVYWDQGGQAQLKVELRPEGGSYSVVGGAQLNQTGSELLTTNEDQPLVIEPSTLLGNDSDVDGDTLSIFSVQNAQNGSVELVDGKVVFTPTANFNGTGSFTYTISDGNGKFDTATVTVGVKPVNDAPVVDSTTLTVAEESVGTPLGLKAPTDIDGDTLTIRVSGLPTVGQVTLANGIPVSNGQTLTSAELQGLKYNAPADYKAGDAVGEFKYSVNDGSTSVEGKVTLGVTPVNDAPVANNDFNVISGLKGNYYAYNEGSDGGNLENLSGVNAFIAGRTPNATFTATELNYGNGVGSNLGNDQQLQKFLGSDAGSLNTDPVNSSDAIIELNGQINLNAGTYQFKVTADDGYSIVIDGKVVAEYNGNQSPTERESATFTISESGAHTIQIVYWDQGGQAQLKVELRPEGGSYSVVGGAQLTQAGNDLLTTNEDQPLVIEPSTLLGNDSDVDGDSLSIFSVQDAQNGSVELVDGKVVFTPTANFNGTGSFTYTISDGNGKFDTATVTVGVKPVNDAPVVDSTSLTVTEDSVGTPLGLKAPTDVDGDALTIKITGMPSVGLITLADGTPLSSGQSLTSAQLQGLKYNAPADYKAGDAVGSFTYSVNDGSVTVNGSVTLSVTPSNDAPVAYDTSLTVNEESGSTAINIQAPTDADGDTLTIKVMGLPTVGSVTLANGTPLINGQSLTSAQLEGLKYTAPTDYNAGQSVGNFTYSVFDGSVTVVGTVTFGVTPVNDAPVVSSTSISVTEESVGTSLGLSAPTDADGDTLTITVTGLPALGQVQLADGTAVSNGQTLTGAELAGLKYNAPADYTNGQAVGSFSYGVSDGTTTVNGSVTIGVTPVNDNPQGANDTANTDEDNSVTIDVLANDSDVDGDSLSLTAASATHGNVAIVDGKLVYTPTGNYSGSDTISYSISDGKGGSSSATVQVTINPVADAPNLSQSQPGGTPHATGLTLQTWNNLSTLAGGGSGANPATVKSTIDGAGTPSSSGNIADAHLDSVSAGLANKLSGLIYLEAGQTYTFSGTGDDSVLVSVGGSNVASATWGGSTGQFSGSFIAAQSGYYTLDIYQHNQDGPGNLDVNIKVGNGALQDLSSANVLLYRNTSDLNGDGVRVSELHGTDGKGYYQVYGYNEGDEDSSIPLSHLSASLVDTDLSESLSVKISQIPTGATITDGTPEHSFTAGASNSVDVSNWNLNSLSITPPANYNGSFALKVTATATEGANGDHASTSLDLPVTVHAVNDAPTSADKTVATDEDTSRSFSSADFAFHDVDSGDSLKAIRINSLPASGTLKLGNEAVSIGMLITAAQIASLVYTPAANASGNSSFSFSVQDQSGAFSTTANTLTIQVAAVDDAPGLADSSVSFAENIASGSTIANLSDRFTGTDQDRDGEPLFYSITGGNNDGLFSINSSTGVITLASGKSLDYETATQHQLQVSATDGKTPVSATITVNVTNINDNGVVITDSNPAANTVAENAANNTTVGLTVQGSDGDVGATITKYELTDNAGGRFAINASTGVVTVADGSKLDYEAATSHNITVKVTSSDGSTNTQVFTINLSNVNDNGVVITDSNPAANTVAENAANNTTVGLTVQGSDGDVGATITKYELTDNAGGRFAINASTGVITVADGSKLDYEAATSHNITVKVTSSDGSTNTQVFTINLSNVNDNGVTISDINAAANQVNENASTGTVVGLTVLGVDGDAGTTVTYSLTNNAGGRFSIDTNSGVVTVADGSKLNYESATSHTITVLATSSDGSSKTQDFSIAVNDVNEAPTVVAGAGVNGSEDSSYVFTWNDFKVSDVDANSSLSIRIESQPGEGKLQIKTGNSWSDVSTNSTVTKAVIDAGGLRFVPDANESGHDSFSNSGVGLNKQTYAEFSYKGVDAGGLTSASSTMSIDIAPVADVPTLSVKSAANATLFTTTWESAPDSNYTSESVSGPTFENWTLVTSGDKRSGGNNVFEIWGHNDKMENQAGNEITIKMPGNNNVDALELNDAGSDMPQTLGISRSLATEAGKVYELSMDYAGRLGFDTSYTKIAVYLGNTLVGEYASTSSQTSLNWENIHFSFVGTGNTEALTIKLAGTSTHDAGRGALIDNISLSSSQGVVAGDGGVSGNTSIALANYISGALTDTDGSESLRYDLSSLPTGASITVGGSTLAAVNGVVSLTAAQLATAKLQVASAVRGEIGLDVKAVSIEPNGSTANSTSQHLTLKIIDGGVAHDSYTTNTITISDSTGTSANLGSGLTSEYWGYAQNDSSRPNLTSLSQVENYIEGRSGNNSSLVGSNTNAANVSVNATFIANVIDYGIKNGSPVFSDDLGDNRNVNSGNSIGASGNSQNNLYDFLTAASTANVSNLKAGGAGLGDTSDAIIRAHGFIDVANAGSYDIRVTADDGYRLLIDGQDVASIDKIQSTATDTFYGVNLTGGLQALELLYWDQGGAATLKIELKPSGSGDAAYKTLGTGDYQLFQATTPASGQELVETSNGWAVHTIQTSTGTEASDLINGSKYSDIINGGNGHDVLYGNAGHDLLNGGDGNDLLIGGVGNDTLTGGTGADIFMWKAGDFGHDVIKDFNAAQGDRIDLSDLLPDTANANNLLDYLKVDTATNTLQVSTTGNVGSSVDVTIKLEGVDLTQYGSTSSQIVNSLVAGADPLVKTEHH